MGQYNFTYEVPENFHDMLVHGFMGIIVMMCIVEMAFLIKNPERTNRSVDMKN